ncbi:MAG: hypothetical protein AABX01_00630, partial [Candidatus Micrarchaeota archaeon]
MEEPKKVRLEEALRRTHSDWKLLRERLKLDSHRLNIETTGRIVNEYSQMCATKVAKTYGGPNDIDGPIQIFIAKHMGHVVGERLGLKPEEKKLVERTVGYLIHNLPPRAYIGRRKAAERLAAMGDRGGLIYSAMRDAENEL